MLIFQAALFVLWFYGSKFMPAGVMLLGLYAGSLTWLEAGVWGGVGGDGFEGDCIAGTVSAGGGMALMRCLARSAAVRGSRTTRAISPGASQASGRAA